MGKRSKLGLGVLFSFVLVACSSTPPPQAKVDSNEYLTGATLWFQTSGEARALMHQTYRLAKSIVQLDLTKKQKKGTLPPAVVVDVDETVLDNSPFEGRVVVSGDPYPKGWDEWVQSAKAKPIPGALEFLNFAHSKGLRVFYLTNRKDGQKEATARNLKEVGFPDVTEETMVVRTAEQSKEARRQKIREKYRIVLLIGDNLADLDKAFDGKSASDRVAAVEQTRDRFGSEYLVIPNPMYGDWEGALYQFNFGKSDEEKFQLRRQALTTFSDRSVTGQPVNETE